MKTNKVKQWAALLLTVSGMAASPLTVAAQNLLVNGTAHPAEADKTYTTVTGWEALLVQGAAASYSGTRIHLSSTLASGWPDRIGAQITQGASIALFDSDITIGNSSGVNGRGFLMLDSTGTVANLTVTTTGATTYGVALDHSTLHADGLNVTTSSDDSIGVRVVAQSTLTGANLSVTTHGAASDGLAVYYSATVTLSGSNRFITTGSNSNTIRLEHSFLDLGANTYIENTLGLTALGLVNGSAVTGVNTVIKGGVVMEVGVADCSLTLTNPGITSAGNAIEIHGSGTEHHTATTVIDGGSITAGGAIISHGTSWNNQSNGILDITLKNGVATHSASGQLLSASGSNSIVKITGENVNLNGSIDVGDKAVATVILNASTLNGSITGGDNASLTAILANSSSMAGDIAITGTGSILLNVSNHSRFDGNIIHDGDALILSLAVDSHGKGNWQHGNLALDPTSSWTFTGSSVIDNFYNDGKVILDVNTDTGDGAHLTVTNQASGTGHVNLNTSGNGTGNPNDILNNIITGNGTDGWIWDEMDWGLEQLVVTPGADGTLGVSKSGKSSTVSALTTGLITAQKGAWFAQQNSLLKRMGDLRMLNDAYNQTTLAGKDDKEVTLSAKNIVDNVWIRAYGQQLNYSADVTGRGFKQYIYGTDIGTDHKFTLNNSNVLYTGIFAGYGAADTDHRYNGSESNLHNYYAGLYASLLNNSGWYIDATLKAQYSDHELKGYHGGIDYFNARYNNWSVGGSLELGKQFKFQDNWFIEPQLQANYVHILASDYNVSTGQQLNVSDLDAFQLRAGIVAGRTLKLKNGGALQPYVKISGVEMLSTGGKVTSGYQSQRPNLDGARAELGAGIIWQLDAHNQLHLDYEASFGDKYDKPWGLTAGYRYQF